MAAEGPQWGSRGAPRCQLAFLAVVIRQYQITPGTKKVSGTQRRGTVDKRAHQSDTSQVRMYGNEHWARVRE